MTISQYIRHAPLRETFNRLRSPAWRYPSLSANELVVPSSGHGEGHVGSAFDYLVRMRLSSVFAFKDVALIEPRWLCDHAIENATSTDLSPRAKRRWMHFIGKAYEIVDDFDWEHDSIEDLAEVAQYLAHADALYRGREFNEDFEPIKDHTTELVALIQLFLERFQVQATTRCFLNPEFNPSDVGSADADLVLDHLLIDLKVASSHRERSRDWLQLASYAALARIAGISGAETSSVVLTSVAIYYARHGRLLEFSLAEILPGSAFDEFCDGFVYHLASWKTEIARKQDEFLRRGHYQWYGKPYPEK